MDDLDGEGVAGLVFGKDSGKGFGVGDGRSAEFEDDVMDGDAGLGGGAVGADGADNDAGSELEIEVVGEHFGDFGGGNADVRGVVFSGGALWHGCGLFDERGWWWGVIGRGLDGPCWGESADCHAAGACDDNFRFHVMLLLL